MCIICMFNFRFSSFNLIYMQGHVDTQQQPFPNGSATTLSLMPGLTLLPGQFGTPTLTEIPPNEANKMDPPAWGIPDTVQDKQHPVCYKLLYEEL